MIEILACMLTGAREKQRQASKKKCSQLPPLFFFPFSKKASAKLAIFASQKFVPSQFLCATNYFCLLQPIRRVFSCLQRNKLFRTSQNCLEQVKVEFEAEKGVNIRLCAKKIGVEDAR